MSAKRLTAAQRECLEMAAAPNDIYPWDGYGNSMLGRLRSFGLLERHEVQEPERSYKTIWYTITDAGRAALKDGGK